MRNVSYDNVRRTRSKIEPLAFEHTTTAIALLDARRRILAANRALCELVGFPRRDVLNRSLAQLLGVSGGRDTESWPQITAGRLPVQFEWLLRSSPGRQQTWVLVDIQPLPLQGGNTARSVVTFHDITERRRATERLAQMQARVDMAFVVGHAALWEWNLDTDEILIDDSMKAWLGYEPDEVRLRTDWLAGLHPDDVERLLALEASVLADDTGTDANGNTPIPEVECRFIAHNGEIVWLLLRGTMLRTADGAPHRVVGTATDITRHRRTEEALRESEARYQSLTGRLLQAQDEERRRIAQELHGVTLQNLSALAMDLTRLEQLLGSGEQTMKHLLEESQALVAAAVNEVRTLSYVLHPPLLDEAGLLSGIKWYIKGFSARSGIDVKLRAPSRIKHLPPDLETAIYRVMQECLTNIHRHSGSSSARISLRKTATDVVLRVSDRGRGMEDAESGPDAIASVGVGIAGMRQRLRQLGGTLDIRSTRQGTTVVASVPILKESNYAPNPGGGRP